LRKKAKECQRIFFLRREHGEFKAIGRKRVRRVLGEMGLKLRRKAIKKQTTDSRHSFPHYENLVQESVLRCLREV